MKPTKKNRRGSHIVLLLHNKYSFSKNGSRTSWIDQKNNETEQTVLSRASVDGQTATHFELGIGGMQSYISSISFSTRNTVGIFTCYRKFSTPARNTIDRLPPAGRPRRGIKQGIIIQGTAPLHRTARRGFIGSFIPDLGAEKTEPLTHFEKHTLPYGVMTWWNSLTLIITYLKMAC